MEFLVFSFYEPILLSYLSGGREMPKFERAGFEGFDRL